MTYQVLLNRSASMALDKGLLWWAENRSPEQAVRWHTGFLAALNQLAHDPDRFPLAPENDLVDFEVRELHYGLGSRPWHRAVFTIRDTVVRVLHIRHAAQSDLQREDLLG